jgi:hypothetical protein
MPLKGGSITYAAWLFNLSVLSRCNLYTAMILRDALAHLRGREAEIVSLLQRSDVETGLHATHHDAGRNAFPEFQGRAVG